MFLSKFKAKLKNVLEILDITLVKRTYGALKWIFH